MISNLDIERRKTGADNIPERSRKILSRAQHLYEHESETLKSKKFNLYMTKVLKKYSAGAEGLKLPRFVSKNFPYLVVSKFNSYDLDCFLIYDFLHNYVFFKRRL